MKNALYVLVMFYYIAYDVRTSLNIIFFVKVPSAIGVFLSYLFYLTHSYFFPLDIPFSIFLLYLFGLLLLCLRIRREGKDLNIGS